MLSRLLLQLLLPLLATAPIVAQQGGRSQLPAAKLAALAERLELNEQQIVQIEELLVEYAERTAAQNPPAAKEVMAKQRRALRRRVVQLLTPEQQVLMRQSRGKKAAPASPPDSEYEAPTLEAAPASSLIATPTKAPSLSGSKQQHWLDALLDSVLLPLLQKRKQ